MLNELEQLRRSLSANGIQATAWHPWIKPLAKSTTLLVSLNAQGEPATVAEMGRERAAKLRNIQPDNQKSLPAFNLNCPIFKAPFGIDLGSPTTVVAAGALASVSLAYQERNGRNASLDRLRRLLREFPLELTNSLSARQSDEMLGSTLQLLKLLKEGEQSPEAFLRSFAEALLDAGRRGGASNELVLEVLFGKLSQKGGREPWKCILFLDLEDLTTHESAVADPETAAAWSQALLFGAAGGAVEEELIECALEGRTGPGIGDKMPNPNLPLLGGTYLFSMNAEIPCQNRYGRSSTALFPVTRHAVQGANDALLHMTARDHEGKTWTAVPSGTGDKPDLLIAYVEETPERGAPATAFGTADEDGDGEEDEKPFSSIQMNPFIRRLNAFLQAVQMESGPEVRGARNLRLFVLSTIDKGRKQVLFDVRYDVANLAKARDRWIDGSQNVPALQVQVFQGKGQKTQERRGTVPSPLMVARSFRDLWIRHGKRKEKVAGVSLGRLYKLLLDPDKDEARSLLERYLPLKLDLLIAAGKPSRNETTGGVYVRTGAALSGPARLDLLTSVAVFGIFLNLLLRKKGTYMNERDYLLGHLLQFADRLHIVYCYGVRGGQVPPQLIGNSLMDQAGQNPAKALAILQQRLPVYERYATQLLHSAEPLLYGPEERDKEKVRLAKLKHKAWKQAGWIKATLAGLSAEVHRLGLEPVSRPQGQAELLLGYLAAPGKDEDSE